MSSKVITVTKYKTSTGREFNTQEEADTEQKEIDDAEANSSFLPWKYCECGCHGLELTFARTTYWTTCDDDTHSSWYLGVGHSFGSSIRLGEFKNGKERDDFLVKKILSKIPDVLKMQINDLKKQLEEVENILNIHRK